MATPLVVEYYYGFTLQTTRRDLSCVAESECCVLTLMAFLLSGLIGASSGLQKTYPGFLELVAEEVLFSISSPVCDVIDAVQFF